MSLPADFYYTLFDFLFAKVAPFMRAGVLLLVQLVAVAGGRVALAAKPRKQQQQLLYLRPTVVDASHDVPGYSARLAVDGDPDTYWLVPGGQRMEAMSCAAATRTAACMPTDASSPPSPRALRPPSLLQSSPSNR